MIYSIFNKNKHNPIYKKSINDKFKQFIKLPN